MYKYKLQYLSTFPVRRWHDAFIATKNKADAELIALDLSNRDHFTFWRVVPIIENKPLYPTFKDGELYIEEIIVD